MKEVKDSRKMKSMESDPFDKIGQFEPGGNFSVSKEILDWRHPDLAPNINSNWLAQTKAGEVAGEGSDGNFSNHATLVAGVMVAAKNIDGRLVA